MLLRSINHEITLFFLQKEFGTEAMLCGMMDWVEPESGMRSTVLCWALYQHVKTKYEEDCDLADHGDG